MQTWSYLLSLLGFMLGSLPDGAICTPSDHEIVNPHRFTYNLNQRRLCERRRTDLLIWIHSSPVNIKKRIFLRNTWANPYNFRNHRVTLVFFLGMSRNETTQKLIEYESQTYKDIVQETFVDSYRNLTYKAIAGCKWTFKYCKSAELVFKADDDMVVDIGLLFRHVKYLRGQGKVLSNTILCDVWVNRPVERSGGRWKVTEAEYNERNYPPYCPGVAVVMTADIVLRLYKASFYEPYFWIDDIYLTGLLARNINVTFETFSGSIHFGGPYNTRETMLENQYQYMFYHIKHTPLYTTMWDMIKQRELKRLKLGTNSEL